MKQQGKVHNFFFQPPVVWKWKVLEEIINAVKQDNEWSRPVPQFEPPAPAIPEKEAELGFVYILTNAAMPGFIKIDPANSVEARAKTLDNTSIPLPFEIFFSLPSSDPLAFEKKVHDVLKDYRVRAKREFFKINPGDARKCMLELADSLGGQKPKYFH